METQLFYFNPTCEMAIANGQVSYMPPGHLKQFESDLDALPFLFGGKNDFILVSSRSENSLDHLKVLGWEVPSLITGPGQLPERLSSGVCFQPWGWSPAVYRVFRPFAAYAHPRWLNGPFKSWNASLAGLLNRGTGYRLLECIRQVFSRFCGPNTLIAIPGAPFVIHSSDDLKQVMKRFSLPAVIKTPWSASGRGLFRIRDERDDPFDSQWVRGMLRRQGVLYAEAWLKKIQDVSFHFWVDENRIEYRGHNFFLADLSGQFNGCVVGFPENPSPLWKDKDRLSGALKQAADLLKEGLDAMGLNKVYRGPVGVDGLFFKDGISGELKLNPCVEVNMRYSMGLANVMLKNKLDSESTGVWRIGHFKGTTWKSFCRENTRMNPPVVERGILKQGFLPLVSPEVPKGFGAWLELKAGKTGRDRLVGR